MSETTSGRRACKLCNSLDYISFADSADLALCLCEDNIGAQFLEFINVDCIDTKRFQGGVFWFVLLLRKLFHLGIDLGAACIDIYLYCAYHR